MNNSNNQQQLDMELQSGSHTSMPLGPLPVTAGGSGNGGGGGGNTNTAATKTRSFINQNLYSHNNSIRSTHGNNNNNNNNNNQHAAHTTTTSIMLKNFQTRNIKMMSLTIISITCIFILLTLPIMLFIICMKLESSSTIDKSFSRLGAFFAELDPNCKSILWALVNIFMYTNHSINFVMYCLTGSKFRTELATLFLPRHMTLSNAHTNNVLTPHMINVTMAAAAAAAAAAATGGRALGGDCDPQAILSNPPLLRKYVTSMQMRQNGGQFGVNKLKKPSMSNHNLNSILTSGNDAASNKYGSPFNKVRSQSIFLNATNDINNDCLD
jgi:hypothetical protein